MDYFYRIEDKDNIGPFTYVGTTRPIFFSFTDDYNGTKEYQERCPLPKYDNCTSEKEGIYGFRTLKQLNAWFTDKEIKFLLKHGYNIVIVAGILIKESDKQVLFKPLRHEVYQSMSP